MIKKKFYLALRWLVLLLYAGLWAYALFQGDFANWFLVYFFSLIILYLGISSSYRLQSFHVKRIYHKTTYYDGDIIQMHLTLTRKFPFPLGYLKLEQTLPNALKDTSTSLTQTVYPLFRKKLTSSLASFTAKRGVYKLAPIHVETSDAFSLIERQAQIGNEDSLTVYPYYFPAILTKMSKLLSENECDVTTWTLKKNDHLHSLREFIPGDRLSFVDWKTTAKAGKMMTREFENSATSCLTVIFYGMSHPDFEYSLRAAYSYSRAVIEKNGEIQIIILEGNNKSTTFTYGKKILPQISQAFAELTSQPESQLIEPLLQQLCANHSAIIFTPAITESLLYTLKKSNNSKHVSLISIAQTEKISPHSFYLNRQWLMAAKIGGEHQ